MMLKGWREEEWMRTATLQAAILNASPNRKKGHTFRARDFHPFMGGGSRRAGLPLTRKSVKLFADALKASRRRR